MNKIKLLFPLTVLLINSGCASIGPTVRIETPEPAEDFVLICDWHSDSLFSPFNSSGLTKQNVYVMKSGEETHCGVAWMGGRPISWAMHPVYWNVEKSEENGILVYRYTGTKLDYLDKQKEKFEAGYWDKYKNPGFEYSFNLVGCGFDNQYLEFYRKVKKIDVEHFKQRYHEPMLACMKRTFSILKKYQPAAARSLINADEWMEKMWELDEWRK